MVPFHSKSLKIRHRLSRWSSRFESDNCHSGGTKLYSVHIGNHNKFILPRQNKIKTGISHKEKSMYIDYSFLLLRERRKGENSLKGLAITFFTNKGEFCIFYQCKKPNSKISHSPVVHTIHTGCIHYPLFVLTVCNNYPLF